MASALTLAHIEAERRLRESVRQEITRIWNGLPGHDRVNLDQWLSEVVPMVEAAQRSSVNLTQAYLARSRETQPVALDPLLLVGAAARNGTKPEEVYTRPFVTLWSELKEGKLWNEAAAMGLDRATSSAATDVQLSMRETLTRVGEVESRIVGYERVADSGACAFCQEVDGAFLLSGEPMPLHSGCGCGVEAIEGERRVPSPLPDGVAIVQHGELGPVLVSPSDHFMNEAEALAR